MDLIDGGEVRRLFSDSELLELAVEEEQLDLRRKPRCAREGRRVGRNDSRCRFRGGVDSTDGDCENMGISHEVFRILSRLHRRCLTLEGLIVNRVFFYPNMHVPRKHFIPVKHVSS